MQQVGEIRVSTRGKGMYDITAEVTKWVSDRAEGVALLTLFCRHTSASLTIQENYDPDVTTDITNFFEKLVPENAREYTHVLEGADDMPAHIRTVLSGVNLSIPIVNGRLSLGSWQGIYLFEHRRQPHTRSIVLHLLL